MVDNGTSSLEDLRDELFHILTEKLLLVNKINHLSSDNKLEELNTAYNMLLQKEIKLLEPLDTVVYINRVYDWIEFNGQPYPILDTKVKRDRYYTCEYISSRTLTPDKDYAFVLSCVDKQTERADKGCDSFMIPGRVKTMRFKTVDDDDETVRSGDDRCQHCSDCEDFRYYVKIETTCEKEIRKLYDKEHFGNTPISEQEFIVEEILILKPVPSNHDYSHAIDPSMGRFEGGVGHKEGKIRFEEMTSTKRQKTEEEEERLKEEEELKETRKNQKRELMLLVSELV